MQYTRRPRSLGALHPADAAAAASDSVIGQQIGSRTVRTVRTVRTGAPIRLSDTAPSVSPTSQVSSQQRYERHEVVVTQDEDEVAAREKPVRITTLGPFTVHLPMPHGPQAALWRDERTRALFKCLLSAPTYWLTREQLIDMLWPELDLARGQDALRHALSRLRRTLEPERAAYDRSPYIASDREAIWLARHPGHDHGQRLYLWVDREHFERLAYAALQHLERVSPAMLHASPASQIQVGQELGSQALLLYRDHFLPADLYVDWARPTRSRCRKLWTALLWRLAHAAVTVRQFDHAQLLLGQLIEAMPDNEGAVSQLMRVQALCGQRGEALRTYDSLARYLASEFGAAPVIGIQHLANAIRSGTVSPEALLSAVTTEPQEVK